MNIGILGAGSWGSAIALLAADNGHNVMMWSVDENEINMLKEHHEHQTKLPGVILPNNVDFTTDMEAASKGMDMVVIVVPSPFVRSTAKKLAPFVTKETIIVNASKGIEEDTLMVLSDVIDDEIEGANCCVLSGPSHAEEVGKRMPTTIVCGAKKEEDAVMIQNAFMNDYFRVYTSSDVLGIELGGALKNVIALAAGTADGLGCGDNTMAALITRGIHEISRLGIEMGGKATTFYGLSGMGDLIVTCQSKHSRNRSAGYLIGCGKSYKEAMDEVKMVVEGVYAAKAALGLAKKYNVEMPIIEIVNKVLFEDFPAKDALSALFNRNKTTESGNDEWA